MKGKCAVNVLQSRVAVPCVQRREKKPVAVSSQSAPFSGSPTSSAKSCGKFNDV
jgi:hypothetical protein